MPRRYGSRLSSARSVSRAASVLGGSGSSSAPTIKQCETPGRPTITSPRALKRVRSPASSTKKCLRGRGGSFGLLILRSIREIIVNPSQARAERPLSRLRTALFTSLRIASKLPPPVHFRTPSMILFALSSVAGSPTARSHRGGPASDSSRASHDLGRGSAGARGR